MRLRYTLTLAAAASLLIAGTALATTFSFVADLKGTNEFPINASPGTGTGFVTYDDVSNTVTTSITFTGLVGNTTASHFHAPAAPGANASVIHGFASTPIGVKSGSYNDVWIGPTSVQVGYLNSQLWYINIHSQSFPGGEIRGQVVPAVTPSRAVSWGRMKSLYR